MNSTFKNILCRAMAIAVLLLPFQTGQASMIGTDQANAAASAQVDRNVVVSYLSRAQTVKEFQSMGLDAQAATDRVARMSDAEVSSLAGKINSAPAGADGGTALVILVVVFFIWYFAFRR